jgi:hypothetical protein
MTRTLLLLGALAACSLLAGAGQPTISIDYSPRLDSVCSIFRGAAIKEKWKAELLSRKPEFEAMWAAIGPREIEAAQALAGKAFPGEHFTARLTLCDFPSQSIVGLSINMRFALQSFASPPVPMRYKVQTLFHELLHVFLGRHPPAGSALLAQHAQEPDCVRNHLHLLALQKAVLLELGQRMLPARLGAGERERHGVFEVPGRTFQVARVPAC